jgi:uncharacterized membrane protein
MIGGFVASLIVFAVGAILDFAVTVSPYQHGFDIRTVGVILMIVGAVGGLFSVIAMVSGGGWNRRRRTIIEDDRGNILRREDTYT